MTRQDNLPEPKVTWHKVRPHHKRHPHKYKIYLKSMTLLLALIILSGLPLFYFTITNTNVTLLSYTTELMFGMYCIACVLLLVSGLNLFKKGLRYGGYVLGIFTLLMAFKFYELNILSQQTKLLESMTCYPSLAFFSIIIVLIIIIFTNKK